MPRLRVLVVDDSIIARKVIANALASDPGIDVYATATDPIAAQAIMDQQWPDVLVLDIEMPKMDGITFLKQIMLTRPTPVVICSALTGRSTHVSVDALAAGAISVAPKPGLGMGNKAVNDELIQQVKAAGMVDRQGLTRILSIGFTPQRTVPSPPPTPTTSATGRIIAIGASTGGTQAIEAILSSLPAQTPPIVIVQHMPERFTATFAARLDSLCRIRVKEAQMDDLVEPNTALVAAGGHHMRLRRRQGRLMVSIDDDVPVNRHRPSVDVLFHSVAATVGEQAIGIVLTGMGDDGAKGLLAIKMAGGYTIAQNEATSIVYGMPREAVAQGGALKVLPLGEVATEMMKKAQAI
jgi:two-component system chemotaxis response regulator CheB